MSSQMLSTKLQSGRRKTPVELLAARAEELSASLTGITAVSAVNGSGTVMASAHGSPSGSARGNAPSGVSTYELSLQTILNAISQDRNYVVSFPGTGQYTAGGTSACGLIGMNVALAVMRMSLDGRPASDLVRGIIKKQFFMDVSAICSLWDSDSHLEVDDICTLPLFKETMKLASSKQGICGLEPFQEIGSGLLQFSSEGRVSAALFTKAPEIVTMISIPSFDNAARGLLAIFDSHPRRSHPIGAGLIFGSPCSLAKHLIEVFHVDSQILNDAAVGWQADLLRQFSVHVFCPRTQSEPTSTAYASTEAILKSRALLAKSCSSMARLESENARLRARVHELETKGVSFQALQLAVDKGKAKALPTELARSQVSGPLRSHRPEIAISRHPPSCSDGAFSTSSMQNQKDDEHYLIALKIQNEINAETERLAREQEELMRIAPQTFDCGICMETLPEDDVAVIDGCGHKFCRADMRGFVASKLSEHRFPIVCPSCSVDENRREHSVVSEVLALQLGLTEEQYTIWSEMQMSSFATMVHCRRCQRTAFIDKKDHDRSDILNCPLPNCIFAWCKTCNQAVEGGVHSCDGTAELESLMRERGYKHCPGCQTPISRTDGCAHMQCTARGCNTHFCYRCGELIVRSARRSDVQAAVAIHYRRCLLFDYGR